MGRVMLGLYHVEIRNIENLLWVKHGPLNNRVQMTWYKNNPFITQIMQKETIDHILIHYVAVRALWQLMPSLFKVAWVLYFTMRNTLLGWHGSTEGRTCKKVWRATPPLHFLNDLEGKEPKNVRKQGATSSRVETLIS